MTDKEPIVGIDLGTTNSSVAIVQDGTPRLIAVDDGYLLPSVVGFSEQDDLLVGTAARNQALVYPERTVSSVKRQMGQDKRIRLGSREYTPSEISAMILRRLKQAAQDYLGQPVERAVITVPAFFSDAQRAATKQAGQIAGLQVERIINEPTAAALCYVQENDEKQTSMIFDLGGGTFDVSVVKIHDEITEVLASHGDTSLGGDDFDNELVSRLSKAFEKKHGLNPTDNLQSLTRLRRAAEEAKIRLSVESYTRLAIEHLIEKDGIPLHLEREISRREYEDIIMPILDRTKDSVQLALNDAKLLAGDLDEVILVGGSTKMPLVIKMLEQMLNRAPRMDVDPDTAVALGAALMAARISGDTRSRILIDVTPYSFGTSCLDETSFPPNPNYYKKVITRNSPLPTRQTEIFYTVVPGQREIDVKIYQGEDPDARNNLLIGRFMVQGLDSQAFEHSEIVFELNLNLDGMLEVEVVERHTGLKKGIVIEDAFGNPSQEQLAASAKRVQEVFQDKPLEATEQSTERTTLKPPEIDLSQEERTAWTNATALIEKAQRQLPNLEEMDRDEIQTSVSSLMNAMEQMDFGAVKEHSAELSDMLFYIE